VTQAGLAPAPDIDESLLERLAEEVRKDLGEVHWAKVDFEAMVVDGVRRKRGKKLQATGAMVTVDPITPHKVVVYTLVPM
jgi:hypothetical protein